MEAAKVARRIEAALEKVGTPERAVGEKRYLKSDLDFLGASLGDIRRATKSSAARDQIDTDEAVDLAMELWKKPVFERRMAAVVVLELHAADLDPSHLSLIEELLRESKTWALVDALSTDVVSEIALHHKIKRKLDRWAKDEDFWVRRASLLAELKPLKAGFPFDPFARRADSMLDESEFFIRKAIGWVLREMSKKRPQEVFDWIATRTHRASGVTMRETVKYLDPNKAGRLMRAYKAGVPLESA